MAVASIFCNVTSQSVDFVQWNLAVAPPEVQGRLEIGLGKRRADRFPSCVAICTEERHSISTRCEARGGNAEDPHPSKRAIVDGVTSRPRLTGQPEARRTKRLGPLQEGTPPMQARRRNPLMLALWIAASVIAFAAPSWAVVPGL